MKTKFFWLALLLSSALASTINAGGQHGGGGGGFAAAAAPAHAGPARGGGSAAVSPGMGGRGIYPGQRPGFPPYYSPAFRQQYLNSIRNANGFRQVAPGNFSGGGAAHGGFASGSSGSGQVRRSGNNLPAEWRNHVVAQRPANWQRNWNRNHDHWWHGHRCHFFNGYWVVFDPGFYPWDYGFPYGYYYPYHYYYPYSYNPEDPYSYQYNEYNGQNGSASHENAASAVSAAQDHLAQHGFYHGAIDGIIGPETRRSISRFQRSHGLRVTGSLNTETLSALGL